MVVDRNRIFGIDGALRSYPIVSITNRRALTSTRFPENRSICAKVWGPSEAEFGGSGSSCGEGEKRGEVPAYRLEIH